MRRSPTNLQCEQNLRVKIGKHGGSYIYNIYNFIFWGGGGDLVEIKNGFDNLADLRDHPS